MDLQLRRQENLRLRQKLMRELYIVESLVHIIYLPFSHGDFKLQDIRGTDLIAKVCQKAYNLIKTIGRRNSKRESLSSTKARERKLM